MANENSPNLLRSLINVCEKASNIARICRSNEQLLKLLVQEKIGEEKNARFQHDFKTLADVLIQETIKNDIGKLFPAMYDFIKGEESPTFTNQEGATVSISVGSTDEETLHILTAIVSEPGYKEALQALAFEVHREVAYAGAELGEIPELPSNLDYADLGIWIDPIDGTAEYINGGHTPTEFTGIAAAGLDCATVLIGVYQRSTGIPSIGVISQPFYKKNEKNCYESRLYWGVALPELTAHNCPIEIVSRENPIALLSPSEDEVIKQVLIDIGHVCCAAAGAGYKALKVITGDANIYVITRASTFRWDTCAPQAILRAQGGNIFDYQNSIHEHLAVPLSYLENQADAKCNKGGVIAVRNIKIINDLLEKYSQI